MDIVQIAHAISYGDATSNQIIAMDKLMKRCGFRTAIFADKIDPKIEYDILPFNRFQYEVGIKVIFHFSTGTSFVDKVLALPSKIILYYHNITPPEFFEGFAWGSYFASKKGRQQLLELKSKAQFAWAASEYSRLELEESGFHHTGVLPIIVDFAEYQSAPLVESIIDQYQDGAINWLFVGRVTPHKKQEDIIRTFYYYKNCVEPNSRLILVGSQKRAYAEALRQLTKELSLEKEVILTNKVSFAEMCTYYRISQAFVCMSEHEGFCVPLLESMYYGLPVFAYDAAAVPYTLGNSGVLFDSKNYPYIAEMIGLALRDEYRSAILAAQTKRLQDFSPDKISRDLIHQLQALS